MQTQQAKQPARPKNKVLLWQIFIICLIAVGAVVLYYTVEFSESSRIVSRLTENDLIAKEHSEAVKQYLKQADLGQVPKGELPYRIYVSYEIFSEKIKKGAFDITSGTEADKTLSQIWEHFLRGDLQKADQMLSELFLSLSQSGSANVLCLTELLATRGDIARIMLDYQSSCNLYKQAFELNGDNNAKARFYILLSLAGTYAQVNEHVKALELLEEALNIKSSGVDIEKEQAINSLVGLSYSNLRLNDYDQSANFAKQVISESDTSSDNIIASKASALFYLGNICESGFLNDDAVDLYKQAYQIYSSIEPVNNPDLCTVAFYLAKAYLSQDITTDVEPLLKQALGGYILFFGKDHPLTAQVYYYLSVLYNKTGKLNEAQEYGLLALKTQIKLVEITSFPDNYTLETITNYQDILITKGLSPKQVHDTIYALCKKHIDENILKELGVRVGHDPM